MKCLSRLCSVLCVVSVIFCCLCVTSFALEDEPLLDSSASGDLSENEVYSFTPVIDLEEGDPLPVVIIPSDAAYVPLPAANAPDLEISNDPPSSSPFYGSGWITGIDDRLGEVTLYFPIDYRSGRFGVDANGYLFNVSSGSLSGYLDGVYNNSVSAPGFSYPRYRDDRNYDYVDLHLIPTSSNMSIATSHAALYGPEQLFPYLFVVLLGGVILCFMKRS